MTLSDRVTEKKYRAWSWTLLCMVATVALWPAIANAQQGLRLSGHGPVFGLTTPTNADGAWALDLGMMGRKGDVDTGVMVRSMLSHGLTEDVQVSWSMPLVTSDQRRSPVRLQESLSK